VGLFVYTCLGTAKDITLGPTAIMSLMVASQAIGDDGKTSVEYALFLSFFAGVMQFTMGLLHLGSLRVWSCLVHILRSGRAL
jgi:sodium-independent sulfate anion transporter 11